jgi:membrane-bound metal-dependent hydrolase YbcI (DUF457 family)
MKCHQITVWKIAENWGVVWLLSDFVASIFIVPTVKPLFYNVIYQNRSENNLKNKMPFVYILEATVNYSTRLSVLNLGHVWEIEQNKCYFKSENVE